MMSMHILYNVAKARDSIGQALPYHTENAHIFMMIQQLHYLPICSEVDDDDTDDTEAR